MINCATPLNRNSPLAKGLLGWWTPLPGFLGGTKLHNLATWPTATLGQGTNAAFGQGWQGNLYNSVKWVPAQGGNHGTLSFNATTNDWVDFNVSSTILNSGTISFLMKHSTDGWPLTTGPGGGFAQGFKAAATSMRYRGWGIDQTVFGLTLSGVWRHILMTSDGSNVRLYVDSALSGTWATVTATQTVDFLVLGHRGDFGEFFGGGIGNVMLYNRCLPQSQITELYYDGREYYRRMLQKAKFFKGAAAVTASGQAASILLQL